MKSILAINGSIRLNSSNKEFIKFLNASLKNFHFETYSNLADLPHFNPDLEIPKVVLDFKQKINQSDYLFIVTPEYAHGIPGVLKNALDWLVSDEILSGKKVVLFVCSASEGESAMTSLIEVTKTMSLDVKENLCFNISRIRSQVREKFQDNEIKIIIESLIKNL